MELMSAVISQGRSKEDQGLLRNWLSTSETLTLIFQELLQTGNQSV